MTCNFGPWVLYLVRDCNPGPWVSGLACFVLMRREGVETSSSLRLRVGFLCGRVSGKEAPDAQDSERRRGHVLCKRWLRSASPRRAALPDRPARYSTAFVDATRAGWGVDMGRKGGRARDPKQFVAPCPPSFSHTCVPRNRE